MEPATIQLVQRFHAVLGLPGLALPAPTQDPLKQSVKQVRDDFSEAMTTLATAVGVEPGKAADQAATPKGKAREAAE